MGFLSNAAKDFLGDYERNNRPSFQVKYWERPTIETLARENTDLLDRFFTRGTPFSPTNAEHIAQREQAGCLHPAVYVIEGDPADTALGWCQLCRDFAHQKEDELIGRATKRRKRDPGESGAPREEVG